LEQEDLQQGQAETTTNSRHGKPGASTTSGLTPTEYRQLSGISDNEGEKDAMLESTTVEREIEQLNADKEEACGKWRNTCRL
jgi:hypothetical protein